MAKYTVEITVTQGDITLESTLEGEILVALKSGIIPAVQYLCEQEHLKGVPHVEILISCDGEYYDSDEGEYDINNGVML